MLKQLVHITTQIQNQCLEAIKWMEDELFICFMHCTGDHRFCKHEPIPEGKEEPLRCEAQKKQLAKELLSVIKQLKHILSPAGLFTINAVEALHFVITMFRKKRQKWSAVGCWLAEIMGFLSWQQLQLASLGYRRHPVFDIAKRLREKFGIDITFDDNELGKLQKKLDDRVQAQATRRDPRSKYNENRNKKRNQKRAQSNITTYENRGAEVDGDLVVAAAEPVVAEKEEEEEENSWSFDEMAIDEAASNAVDAMDDDEEAGDCGNYLFDFATGKHVSEKDIA